MSRVSITVSTTDRDHVSVHGTQVFQQVRFLLEHRYTETTREGLLPCVDAEVCLEVPAHAELFAAVLAAILSRWCWLAARRAAGFHLLTTCSRVKIKTNRITKLKHEVNTNLQSNCVSQVSKMCLWIYISDRRGIKICKKIVI